MFLHRTNSKLVLFWRDKRIDRHLNFIFITKIKQTLEALIGCGTTSMLGDEWGGKPAKWAAFTPPVGGEAEELGSGLGP